LEEVVAKSAENGTLHISSSHIRNQKSSAGNRGAFFAFVAIGAFDGNSIQRITPFPIFSLSQA
jgi:hypothetical protein